MFQHAYSKIISFRHHLRTSPTTQYYQPGTIQLNPVTVFSHWYCESGELFCEFIPDHHEQRAGPVSYGHIPLPATHFTVAHVNFVGPSTFSQAVPSLCSIDSFHGKVEVRHRILEDMFGNPGACSSSTLRHVVVGMRLARVLAFSCVLRSARL